MCMIMRMYDLSFCIWWKWTCTVCCVCDVWWRLSGGMSDAMWVNRYSHYDSPTVINDSFIPLRIRQVESKSSDSQVHLTAMKQKPCQPYLHHIARTFFCCALLAGWLVSSHWEQGGKAIRNMRAREVTALPLFAHLLFWEIYRRWKRLAI